MTPFLVATLLALIAGGTLTLIWRERREQFTRALAAAVALIACVVGYAWWVSHGYMLTGDAGMVSLSKLKLEPVAGSYRLEGIVGNTSRELAVSAVPIHLRVSDCIDAAKPATCTGLFDMTRPLQVSLPPGESHAFVLVFSPPTTQVHGSLQWQADAGTPRTYTPVPR